MKNLALLLFFTALVPLGASHAAETVIYKKAGARELKLSLEKPADWKVSDKRPAVVFFFGGGWVAGNAGQFAKQSEYLASRGIVGVRVEYRTIPKGESGPPTIPCADAKSALRYVRSHAGELGIDPQRIAAAGGSAGGHLAAFTALVEGQDDANDDLTVSCKPNALVLFNPVFNNGPGQWGNERVGQRYKEFSPAHNIRKDAPPTIVFLGDEDKLIPLSVLRDYEAKMKEVGARCETHVYEKAGHGFFNREPYFTLTLIEADKFLTSLGWLNGPPTLKSPATQNANYEERSLEGSKVFISNALLNKEKDALEKALGLLQKQLADIERTVPPKAAAKLRAVPLWFSPEYAGTAPRAEYHPSADWLREHGRNPLMAKGVEFTNVRIFEAECKRMPNFALHELSHAFHDLALPDGFDNAEIKAAFERAKASKSYDKVERWHGDGRPNTFEQAYAMTNPQEYFAECSEAFFARNDFFPFTRDELKKHDPEMEKLLAKLWGD